MSRFACASDLREIVAEQAAYRELLCQMTRRDLLLRYKQTVIGFGWAVFMPLVNTIVFSMVFMKVAPVSTGLPYPLFAYCGLVAWNFTAASLRFGVNSLTGNVSLVTKVYFPREILPVSAVLVSLVDFAVGSLLLVAMMAYYQIAPGWAVLALPAVVAVHVAFTIAVALSLAMANLFYRDVKYLFEIAITVWMFATSVLYPVTVVGGRLQLLLQLNPMTHIIEAYRSVLLRGELPPASFAATAVGAVLCATVALVVFHRAEYRFAENI
jgi:ABC-type polysaccharide/polyol phosphate export permease